MPDFDALLSRPRVKCGHQARTAARGFDRHAAPELEPALDLEGLAAIDRLEAHALGAHPHDGVEAPGDEQLGHVGVGAVLCDPAHIVEELFLGIGAEIGAGDLFLGEVGHHLPKVRQSRIGTAHAACREAAVAAVFLDRRTLKHQHRCARLAGRQRRAHGGVPRARPRSRRGRPAITNRNHRH